MSDETGVIRDKTIRAVTSFVVEKHRIPYILLHFQPARKKVQ